jgi:hypothetical protein
MELNASFGLEVPAPFGLVGKGMFNIDTRIEDLWGFTDALKIILGVRKRKPGAQNTI